MTTEISLGALLRAARERISSTDAQALLGAVLDAGRAYLLAHPEQPVPAEQAARYRALVERCAAGEPLAYLLGRRAFYDREFIVSPAVLIPRPETELLLELALTVARRHSAPPVAVDVGTGSGALAVTLAALVPAARVYATDISPAALAVARRNAALHQAQVTFLQGDLLEPVIALGVQADLLLANLPYVASGDLPGLDVSRYEPLLALDGGPDGLALVRRLLAQSPAVCRPGAHLLLEIGAGQGAAALARARAAFPQAEISLRRDYAGHDRLVQIALPPDPTGS